MWRKRQVARFVRLSLPAVLIAGAVVGCKSKDAAPPAPGVGQPLPPPPVPPPPPVLPPVTGEALIKKVRDCFAAADNENQDQLSGCYDPNASFMMVDSHPTVMQAGVANILGYGMKPFWAQFGDIAQSFQLVVTNGQRTGVIVRLSGKQDGATAGQPATGKEVGVLTGHLIETNNPGQALRHLIALDQTTLDGQTGKLPPRTPFRALAPESLWAEAEQVVGKNDRTEESNKINLQKVATAFSENRLHDVQIYLHDDVVLRDMSVAKDVTGAKAVIATMKSLRAGFSGLTYRIDETFAAGPWTVSAATLRGHNDGPVAGTRIKAKGTGRSVEVHSLQFTRWDEGKIREHLVFSNGQAKAAQLGLIQLPDVPPLGVLPP